MRILFLCGCIEFGKDGVGDYTQILACELYKEGIESVIVSLNEPKRYKINTAIYQQVTPNSSIRLNEELSWKQRFKQLKHIIEEFKPEWISLQFVPFSFHKKGLPYNFLKHLKSINRKAKWHIMFHEIWIGIPDSAPLIHKIWGSLQKLLVRKLLHSVSFNVKHTNSAFYMIELSKLTNNVCRLPLFSNIPNFYDVNRSDSVSRNINCVFFGFMHPEARYQEFLEQLIREGKKNTIVIHLLGKTGYFKKNILVLLSSHNIKVIDHGYQPEKTVSKILNTCDFGVSTTAPSMLDKSGGIAAMRLHGLPVVCIGDNWTVKGKKYIPDIENIFVLGKHSFAFSRLESREPDIKYLPSNIASKFITQLK